MLNLLGIKKGTAGTDFLTPQAGSWGEKGKEKVKRREKRKGKRKPRGKVRRSSRRNRQE